MEKNNPNDMKGIMTRVKREDWSLDNVRQSQEAVSKFASALLKSMKETKE